MEKSDFAATLTGEEIADLADRLRELTTSPGWAVYCSLVKDARLLAREQALADPEGRDHYDYWKGYVQGLEVLETLPAELLARGTTEVKKAAVRRRGAATFPTSHGPLTR